MFRRLLCPRSHAPEAKIRSKELKTRQSTSRNLYFRICGHARGTARVRKYWLSSTSAVPVQ